MSWFTDFLAALGLRKRRRPTPPPAPVNRPIAVVAVGRPYAQVALLKGTTSTETTLWDTTSENGYFCCYNLPEGEEIPVTVQIKETEKYEPYSESFVIPATGNHDLICGEFANPAPHQHVLPPSVRKVLQRTGVPRADGGAFVDDQGSYHALGTTLFWAGWGYKFDRDRLEQNLRYAAQNGIDYIRVLGEVGPESGWEDRQMDPTWDDYDQVIAGLTDLAYDKYGLRVEWSIFGGVGHSPTPSSRDRLVRRFADMARLRGHKIQHFEIANEGWHTGFAGLNGFTELRVLAGIIRENTMNLVATTAPTNDIDAKTLYEGSKANILTMHLDRSWNGTGREWRPVRQAWEVQYLKGIPRCWTSNEPNGPGSSVSTDSDPLRIAMSAAVTWLCGGAGYVLHTGAGIRGKEDSHPVGGRRPPNLWEVENIDAILSGLRTVRSLVPLGIQNWSRHNSNDRFPQYPFDTDLTVAAIDRGDMLRAFAAINGVSFVCMPLRITRAVEWKARISMHVEAFEPITGIKIGAWDLTAKQSFTLTADHPAVILLGRFTS